ncbi:amidase family protein [Paracoccus saliphilus]|uniref:Amidase n=1 Tax=Paracoccus saliphilus TaxID=405559 RepID=A0AA46A6N9_9RHOB|nr:amidase family protein [Paracoccus saliphilus]WCR04459.1 hypothetical protein JHX88_06955 [Paracoccus saliphilus]SIT01035.1 Amidase [Paracoccus saliphilus]
MELHQISLTGAVGRIRSGEISALEYSTALVERAQAFSTLNAFTYFDPERVLDAARQADLRQARGEALGPLHGVPLAIKDSIDIEGLPTGGGTPVLRDNIVRRTAPMIRSLFDAGALCFGKTNLYELAFGITSNNRHTGAVRNPCDSERSAGGSSGGSAAAVAAGMVPAAIGSDTAGSVRIPAAHCGILGFRPSHGRYDSTGFMPLFPSRDAPGVMARSVEDPLRSVGRRALLSGANLLAIGDGSAERWELLQFARAEPVGDGIWEIRERLRGQAGTDGVMPRLWPAGSLVVLIDGAVRQVALPPSARGQERFWRIGPALRAPDDASYRGLVTGARGIGLRPYAPCHLRIEGRRVSWIRRARVDGDGWDGPDVPLGEAREAYLLRLSRGGEVIHQVQVPVPEYRVPEEVWSAALAGGAFTVAVAQLSDQFGAGPFVRRDFNDGA